MFFAIVLGKKFTNPSSDIIEVLAGLDNVDAVFTELVTTLDQAIKEGRTSKMMTYLIQHAFADFRQSSSGRRRFELRLRWSLEGFKLPWFRTSSIEISFRR